MRRQLALLALVALLIFTVQPAIAKIYRDDIDIDKNIEPYKKYYLSRDEISVNYTIEIVNEDKKSELAKEEFTVCTYLKVSDAWNNFRVWVNFAEGGGTSYPTESDQIKREDDRICISFQLPNLGVSRFKIELNGEIPEIDERFANLEILNFTVECFDEDALKPVTVKVVNTEKFEEDLDSYENKIKELEADYNEFSKSHEADELETVVLSLKNCLEKAKKYYEDGRYDKSEEYLEDVEDGFKEYEHVKYKVLSRDLKDRITDELRDLKYLLDEIDLNLTHLYNERRIDNVVYLRYDKILSRNKDTLKDLETRFKEIESEYYDKEIYNISAAKFEKLLNDIAELKNEIEDLNLEVASYFATQPSIIDRLVGEYLPYVIALIAVVIIAVVSVVFVRMRRGGRWDELR